MKYMSYVIDTMREVKAKGIVESAERETILNNLHVIFHCTGWKKGEIKTTHKLLELVLNTKPIR